MNFAYEKLAYQEEAVNSVINTLSGYNDISKEIITDKNELDKSVKKTLLNNGHKYPGNAYLNPFPQFNIEMETGTGKTMVYLQTIMALHKRFNENKFIIVVPSRAIKAGVEDSLNNLKTYLSDIYDTDRYHYFSYNSKELYNLQNFQGNSFEIMVTTIQAFNKNSNVINQEYNEIFFGGKPLQQIQNSHPIVVIDEPQSVDSAKAGKSAISSLNPKLSLRYSATHKDRQYPLIYEFGPVKAYQEHMVKQIETLGTEIDTDGNIPTIKLSQKPEFKNGKLCVKVLVYKKIKNEFVKRNITLYKNDSLYEKTKNNKYKKFGIVTEINSIDNFVEFENGYKIESGSVEGEDELWISSQMRAMIKDHLDRELKMQDQGIKVLSLIFIDKVKNYRVYTKKGFVNGKYAKLFENLYIEVLNSDPKYKNLYDFNVPVTEVHDGYFAKDKATKSKPRIYRDTGGDTLKDESAYKSIISDKKGLLTKYLPGKPETDSKSSKLRFIFSHSALKEGWDNPNVFQIFTITTPKNDLTRRQKIGRGLRIPVNQEGKRVYNDEQNVVTIYANETFEKFALGLQNEYLESGIFINKIGYDFFNGLIVDKDSNKDIHNNSLDYYEYRDNDDSNTKQINYDDSAKFVDIIKNNNIIKNDGSPTLTGLRNLKNEKVKNHIIDESLESGIGLNDSLSMIDDIIVKFDLPKPIDRRKRSSASITDENNKYFKSLWNKIKYKVNYRINFSEKELINDIVYGNNPVVDIKIKKMTAIQTRARVNFYKSGLDKEIIGKNTEHLVWPKLPISDITREIADRTGLTRQAIIDIILKSEKINGQFIDKIKKNPSLFVNNAIKNIEGHQRTILNKSLIYYQNGDIWPESKIESFSALDSSLWKVPDHGLKKTLFNKIFTQSKEEDMFAQSLVDEENVKYFLKLPNWFKIPTPFGNYNPDWAILVKKTSMERLYFIVDTKSTIEMSDLRENEQARIYAGRKAYESKGFEDVNFEAPIKSIDELL